MAPPPAPALARASVLLRFAALALAAFALVGTWMPALGDPRGTDGLWSLDPSGLRVQAVAAALATAAAAGGWLAAAALGGGLLAGLPLFLAAADLAGRVQPGLVLLTLAVAATRGCAVAGVHEAARDAGAGRRAPEARCSWPRAAASAGAASLAGAVLAYAGGAAIGFDDLVTGPGLGLVLSGAAVAATTVAIGGAAMALRVAGAGAA